MKLNCWWQHHRPSCQSYDSVHQAKHSSTRSPFTPYKCLGQRWSKSEEQANPSFDLVFKLPTYYPYIRRSKMPPDFLHRVCQRPQHSEKCGEIHTMRYPKLSVVTFQDTVYRGWWNKWIARACFASELPTKTVCTTTTELA